MLDGHIICGDCELKSITEVPVEYVEYMNNPKITKYLDTKSATKEELEKYIYEKNNSDSALLLGLYRFDTQKLIGTIKLEPIVKNDLAWVGLFVAEPGKKHGSKMLSVVAFYAFKYFEVQRIWAGVLFKNLKAQRFFENFGFKKFDVNERSYIYVLKEEDLY